MRKYIYFSFIFFILVALSGVAMRYYQLSPQTAIPYDHILHAHSHLALLGWIFIIAFIIFLALYWQVIEEKNRAITILFSLVIVSILMFIAFLYEGYGVYSIILSTVHIFVEYWAAVFIWKRLKKVPLPQSAKNFISGGLIALIISSIGPFALGAISMSGNKEHAIFEMAIYFYLHFQYNGWLTFFLIGLFIILLHKRQFNINESLLQKAFIVYFIALFPNYLHSILWIELPSTLVGLSIIGSLGQWIGIIMIFIALKDIWKELKNHYSRLTTWLIGLSFGLLLIKSTMELGMIYPGLAELVNSTRSVIIGYLHLTLLGFITIFILAQLQMAGLTKTNRFSSYSFSIFFLGFALNEFLLFFDAFGQWTAWYKTPYFNESLLIAAILLTIGVIMMTFTVNHERKTPRVN